MGEFIHKGKGNLNMGEFIHESKGNVLCGDQSMAGISSDVHYFVRDGDSIYMVALVTEGEPLMCCQIIHFETWTPVYLLIKF